MQSWMFMVKNLITGFCYTLPVDEFHLINITYVDVVLTRYFNYTCYHINILIGWGLCVQKCFVQSVGKFKCTHKYGSSLLLRYLWRERETENIEKKGGKEKKCIVSTLNRNIQNGILCLSQSFIYFCKHYRKKTLVLNSTSTNKNRLFTDDTEMEKRKKKEREKDRKNERNIMVNSLDFYSMAFQWPWTRGLISLWWWLPTDAPSFSPQRAQGSASHGGTRQAKGWLGARDLNMMKLTQGRVTLAC